MRIYRLLSTAIGGVLFAGVSSAAHAGCFGAPAPNCNPAPISYPAPVSYPAPMDRLAPVNTFGQNPYGHLRTVEYKNTPNVNVMRLRSRTPMVRLNDGPSGLTGDCNPAGVYCGAPQGRPVNVTFAPAPQYVAPPAPVQPRVTIGSGYNPAAFAPRQYGSTDFVPGIAHVPTSIVDRSPITHIDGVPQPTVRSITTAPMSAPMMAAPMMSAPMMSAPMMPAPMTSYSTSRSYVANTMPTRRPAGNVIGSVVTNQYSYQPAGGGAYWEKTSGPTIVDGLPATQILCRREAPRPAPVNVRVVSPVIGVPYPVPTPVPVAVNTCGSAAYSNGFAAPTLAGGPSANRYGSRWTY